MNAETVFQIKTEAFAMPHDPYCYETRTYPAFTDLTHLSNRQFDDCFECRKDQMDYACSMNTCFICLGSTMYGKRYCCFLCNKVFHEACRNNPELASSTGRWICWDCKYQEKQYSSAFIPRIQNVITMANDRNFQMPAVKSEKYDWPDCGSDKCDWVGCRSASLNMNRNAALPPPNRQQDVVPAVQDPNLHIKDEIVEKVAKSFLQKMNNAGRKRTCDIVSAHHFGPIPGIPVGTCWKYRLQVSESGVHRPLVAGIHGKTNEGACSIVMSGCYTEDEDFGFEFYYSGCGGRDHDPHKRLNVQTQDQKLTRLNRALALSCNAPFNDQIGAESSDWQGGKPVRVVRNFKLRKHSEFAPAEGNRYDGIYKVVKYFPAIGQTGLVVWKYLMRRDDPEPAPWTEEGKRIIEEKDLRVIYPCGYENKQIMIKTEKSEQPPPKKATFNYNAVNRVAKMEPYDPSYAQMNPAAYPTPAPDYFHEEVDIKPDGTVLQASIRPPPSYDYNYSWHSPPTKVENQSDAPQQSASSFQLNVSSVRSLNPNASNASAGYNAAAPANNVPSVSVPENNVPNIPAPAHNICTISQPVSNYSNLGVITIKEEAYELPAVIEKLIDLDTANETIWVYCKAFLGRTEKEFKDVVRLMFLCRTCSRLLDRPATTPCNHNICLKCITNHFSKGQFSCPECCYYLGTTFTPMENQNLASVLENLFSGYNT